MRRKRKNKLSTKFTVGFLILGVLICTVTCTIGYVKYKTVIEKMYNDTAYQIAHVAETYIDGDAVERYLKTGTTDAQYEQSLQKMNALRDNMGANYIYVAQQVGVDLTYVMDADNPNDTLPPFVLGDTGRINPQFLEDSIRIVEKGERVENYFYSHSQFGYNTSAIIPLHNSKQQIVGIIGVEIAMSRLDDTLFEYVFYAIVISSLLVILFIAAYLVYLRRHVVGPIQSVTREAHAFTENAGEISKKLDNIKTGDEIQDLAAALKTMELDIHTYIKNLTEVTAEKERIGAELDVAKHIQASMLPCIFPAFPERTELDIYATMTPAKEVGGDFYDFFLIDDDQLAMVMADVSGKGVPAALFMVIAKTLLKNVAQTGLTPKDVLEKVNNQLCVGNEAEMFVTVWLGILEISTGKLTCANAGHEYPVLKRTSGDYELIKDKHGFVLAGMEGSRYKEYELQMNPGDRLFLYTDGVAEATNAHNELYGTDRMLSALNRYKDSDCEILLHQMKEDIDVFVGEAPQFDDITMLSLELRPQNGSCMKKLKLTPTLEVIDEVTTFVEKELEDAGVSTKVIAQMNIAVDEIFSNIVRYSGASDATVGVAVEEGRVTLRFADNGLPYDPTQKTDPDITDSADVRDIGGLGIFMVKKSMDTVVYEYQDGLNILTLTKH